MQSQLAPVAPIPVLEQKTAWNVPSVGWRFSTGMLSCTGQGGPEVGGMLPRSSGSCR